MGIRFDCFVGTSYCYSLSKKIAKNVYGMPLKPFNSGAPEALTLASFIALCSASLGKPVQGQMVVLGDMSLFVNR